MAHNEPSKPEDSAHDSPTVPPRSGTGPEATTAPKSNAINMALLELQGDIDVPERPAPPTEPARGTGEEPLKDVPPPPQPAESPVAESQLTPPPVEKSPLPEPESAAARLEETAVEPSPVTASSSLSSTPPISGRLERPSQRPPRAESPAPQPATENAPSLTTVLVAAAVVSLLFGLLGTWVYNRFFWDNKPPAVTASTTAPEEATPSLSAAELDPLKTRLGELGEQMDEFEKQLDDVSSKGTASADLTPIRQQIDDVAKAMTTIDPLAKRIDGISTRIEGIETSVNDLKGEFESLETKAAEPEKGNTVPTSTPISSTPTAVPAASELALENVNANLAGNTLLEGAELFKKGQYQQAYDIFAKLEKTNENDARVWYYAALSYGLASGEWGETTVNLAKKGVEREKAGTPKSSEIDALFRDLDSGTGKEWLAFKRKDVMK